MLVFFVGRRQSRGMTAPKASALVPASTGDAASVVAPTEAKALAAIIFHTSEVLFARRAYSECVYALQAITQNATQFPANIVSAAHLRVARTIAADIWFSRLSNQSPQLVSELNEALRVGLSV
jgi:hypothetical protein